MRYASWYIGSWSTRGKAVCRIARDDNAGRTGAFFPLKKSALLGAKAMDVLRMMLLLQNAASYLAHVLVANKVHFGRHLRNAKNPPTRAKSTEHPHLPRAKIRGENCDSSPSGSVGPTPSCSDDDDEGAESIACDASIRETSLSFSIGSASVEAFFSKIWLTVPFLWNIPPIYPQNVI